MATKKVASKGSLYLAYCLPCLRHNASKFRVRTMELDERLLMHFTKTKEIFAYDPNKICKAGDMVLIQELPERISTTITHKVLEVIYPNGDITDPITGKQVVGSNYREHLEMKETLLGKSEMSFNYKKAPKRGWQEGKKDFTHREAYMKYHEFPKGDENELQPFSKSYI
ncbi:hypothetical protein RUM43_014609 [Polyplax serrata]|uniref:Ribosomal protein S17 n=1 Tax=Polyplax serrata TaxID=468196 RepID=A0AAN8P137_POLSC